MLALGPTSSPPQCSNICLRARKECWIGALKLTQLRHDREGIHSEEKFFLAEGTEMLIICFNAAEKI